MINQSLQVGDKQSQSPSPTDIFTFGAQQLADIIYETIRLRETNEADQITKLPSEPSEHA